MRSPVGGVDAGLARRLLRQAERAMTRAAGTPPIFGNSARLLIDGPDAFRLWLDWIGQAERYIHLENYIIRNDRIGHRFRDALIERCRDGVAVRVLYDWAGCWATPRHFWTPLVAAGAEVRAFGRPRLRSTLDLLRRDHRKTLVVDGRRASVVGMCIGDEWAGESESGQPPWRDAGVAFEGPVAARVNRAFSEPWSASGPPLPDDALLPGAGSIPVAGNVGVRIVEGEPGRSRIYRLAQLVTAGVESRLWITDPYFVAPPAMVEAIAAAARDGVDVRVIVPAYNNWPVTGGMSRAGYRSLLEAGVRLFEWEGPMIHAKTMVADGIWTRIGSSNLNLASLLGNYELDAAIIDSNLGRQMEEVFLRDLERSVEVHLPSPGAPKEARRYVRERYAEGDASRTAHDRRREASRGSLFGRIVARVARAGSVLGRAILGYGSIGAEDRGWIAAIGLTCIIIAVIGALVPAVLGWPLSLGLFLFGVAALLRILLEREQGGEGTQEGGEGTRGSAG